MKKIVYWVTDTWQNIFIFLFTKDVQKYLFCFASFVHQSLGRKAPSEKNNQENKVNQKNKWNFDEYKIPQQKIFKLEHVNLTDSKYTSFRPILNVYLLSENMVKKIKVT